MRNWRCRPVEIYLVNRFKRKLWWLYLKAVTVTGLFLGARALA